MTGAETLLFFELSFQVSQLENQLSYNDRYTIRTCILLTYYSQPVPEKAVIQKLKVQKSLKTPDETVTVNFVPQQPNVKKLFPVTHTRLLKDEDLSSPGEREGEGGRGEGGRERGREGGREGEREGEGGTEGEMGDEGVSHSVVSVLRICHGNDYYSRKTCVYIGMALVN